MKKLSNNSETYPKKKKSLGQHFLRKQSVVDHMINKVGITAQTSILEIGCGDGFLTKSILLQSNCKQLCCYEIDPMWADVVEKKIQDPRLTIVRQNILEADLPSLKKDYPWVVLANLPYQITFPIMFLILENKDLFEEGVVMMQEEVAQKIVATKGRNSNATSLLLQYYFNFQLMDKIGPESFSPPPKVNSRLLYFKPKTNVKPIPNEQEFWKLVKACYKQPRRTLRNNLSQTHYELKNFSDETLNLRAQQLTIESFLQLWENLQKLV